MALLLTIRWYLVWQNKKRDVESIDDLYDDVYIERLNEDGVMEKVKVDKVRLSRLTVHQRR